MQIFFVVGYFGGDSLWVCQTIVRKALLFAPLGIECLLWQLGICSRPDLELLCESQ